MTTTAQREFLAVPRSAVLATIGPVGRSSQSVVWFRLDGNTVWVSASPGSTKVRHLIANPECSLLVLGDGSFSYVRVEGTAEVSERVSAADRLALVGPYVGVEQAGAWTA